MKKEDAQEDAWHPGCLHKKRNQSHTHFVSLIIISDNIALNEKTGWRPDFFSNDFMGKIKKWSLCVEDYEDDDEVKEFDYLFKDKERVRKV